MHERPRRLLPLVLFGGLALATLLVYQPVWFGGPLWDDDGHMTRLGLRSWEGLRLIWFNPHATQQYYPLMHSSFWIMQRLWGDAPLGYHLVNILLHVSSAFVLWVLLQRLKVPGAAFVAFLFALHPVQVESVAWITELKNTQSTLLYLLAAASYLRFDESRRASHWTISAVFFALALMTKTVTATLPVSLLVVLWWKRGRIDMRRDVAPLLPFVVIGLAAGLGTAWVERTLIGATGSDFNMTLVERCLIAGRAVWFYAWTLLWPAHLAFTYPRWVIDESAWWQYLFPTALAAVLAGCWWIRGRTRGPLAALLLFVVALGPALGFVNVYPFIYSFVADHFQYTATVAACAALGGAATALARLYITSPRARMVLAAMVLAPLAATSWQLSHQYVSAETLYRSTIARNPEAWMAHQNLAAVELANPHANLDEAAAHLRESLRLKATNAEAHNNLGYLCQRQGRFADARREYMESIRLNPRLYSAHNNLGTVEQLEGNLEGAMAQYREVLRGDPANVDANRNLALVLLGLGRIDEAAPMVEGAFKENPGHPDVIDAMGALAVRRGQFPQALAFFEAELRLRPGSAPTLVKLATVYEDLGQPADAAKMYTEALSQDPASAIAHDGLGYFLLRQGQFGEAASHLQEAIRLQPTLGRAYASLADALQSLGRLDESITTYRRALQFPENAKSPAVRNDFGVALAQRGRVAEATAEFREALRLDPSFQDARANLARAGGS